MEPYNNSPSLKYRILPRHANKAEIYGVPR